MLIKVFFLLRISYLRIKSYNVLNYNNCSTDWSFPLRCLIQYLTLELFLLEVKILMVLPIYMLARKFPHVVFLLLMTVCMYKDLYKSLC